MRSYLAGILCCMLPAVAFAQAVGSVESIGFADYFRPGCWTPMLVYLKPTTGGQFTGRIEVVQEDLDRDQVLFTRQITLTGNPPNGLMAVTVVGGELAIADGYATAAVVLGWEGMEWLAGIGDIEAMGITDDRCVVTTSGFARHRLE